MNGPNTPKIANTDKTLADTTSGQYQVLEQLIAQQHLTEPQSRHFFTQVVNGQVDPIILSAALTALKIKGETATEISGAAGALRDNCLPFADCGGFTQGYADNCGTGGDGSNTFNISTTASIVAAAAGLPIVKHGNRSVSSRSGSADMLESLGLNLQMSPAVAFRCLTETNLTFLFAPHYHAGIKHAMTVRKTLRTRTLFNILGPLVNPAKPTIQLLGVFKPSLCRPMAEALVLLGVKRAMVVHGSGTDEIALHGQTKVVEINQGKLKEYTLSPQDFGLSQYTLAQLAGGDPSVNAKITEQILIGKGSDAQRSAIAINVAALLYLFGRVDNVKQGAEQAMAVIEQGRAAHTMAQFIALSNESLPENSPANAQKDASR